MKGKDSTPDWIQDGEHVTDDDHVIAAALAGQARIIASGDKHLLGLGTYQAIRILHPAKALAAIPQPPG